MDLEVFTPGVSVGQRVVDTVIGQVGRQVFRNAVAESYRLGARTVQQAVDYAVYRLREGPGTVKYTNRKRDIEGEIKPEKLNFDDIQAEPQSMGDDIQFSRVKSSIGRPRKRSASELWKHEIGRLQEYVFRWQRCSLSLLGPGATPLSYGRDPAQSAVQQQPTVVCPVHVMSLTNCPLFGSLTSEGAHFRGMARLVYRKPRTDIQEPIQGNFGYQWLSSQTHNGIYNNNGSWQFEKGNESAARDNHVDKVFHKYTDIRMNLYGSMRFPLDYTVTVVSGMPLEMQMFNLPSVETTVASGPTVNDFPIEDNTPLSEFLLNQVRPIISNPILGNSAADKYKGKFRILHKKKYHVPCLSYGDAVDLVNNSSLIDSTNVKQVNLFLRHDRFRDYKWLTNTADVVDNDDLAGMGFDQTEIQTERGLASLCDVDYKERVFLMITCTSPQTYDNVVQNVAGAVFGPEVVQSIALNTTGTYDIVVRNCFRAGNSGL